MPQKLEFSEVINPNTEFINGRGFWAFYFSLICLTYFMTKVFTSLIFEHVSDYSLTIVNAIHAVITLYAMHWVKGARFSAPFWTSADSSKFDQLTWWEQVDNGKQNTMTKKILTLIPVVLCIVACNESQWTGIWTFINFVALIISVVGKFPFMHKIRILGINSD